MYSLSYLLILFSILVSWTTINYFIIAKTSSSEDAIEVFLNEKHDDWWIVEHERDKTRKVYIRFVDLDEGKIHSCYQYKVVELKTNRTIQYDTFCYPSIIITGMRKCSTSALYNLMAHYPNMKKNVMKENCAFIGDRSITQYFDSLPRNIEINEIIFDGCVDLLGNIKMRKILRNPNTFYVVLTRDYTDLLWSSYNFWCDPLYDKEWCSSESERWVNADFHYRSPEAFHDIILGSINGTNVPSPLQDKTPCVTAKSLFKSYIQTLWQTIPVENTIILASEDLENNPQYIWNRLSKMIGLGNDAKHPKLAEFQKVRYNTQVKWGSKGESNKVSIDEYKPGLYFASKFKPVYQATREALNKCWYEDCRWISKVTGHSYECIAKDNAMSKQLVNTNIGSQAPDNLKMNNYINEAFPKSNFSLGFFQRAIRKCLEQFGNRNKTIIASKDINVSNKKEKSNYYLLNNAILLLSLSKTDRLYMKHLLKYSADIQYFIEESDYVCRNSNIQNQNNKPIVISSNPSKVKLISDIELATNPGDVYLTLTNSSCCKYNNANIAFKHVIIVVKDAMGIIWTKYQKSLGFSYGLKETDFIFLNWTHWEYSAIGMLANESNDNSAQTFWNRKHSLIIDKVPRNNKKVIIIEDIRYSQSKLVYLYEVIKFIKSIMSRVVVNVNAIQINVSAGSLSCANILANYNVGLSQTHDYVSKGNIDLAYASDDLVCSVKKYFSSSSLQLESLSFPHSTTCENGISLNTETTKKCKLRYTKRTFLTTVLHHPISLLSTAGLETTNVRLLIEHTSGIYSGSMDTSPDLADLLHGENFCGQRLSIIQTNPKDVTIKYARSGHGVVSLTNNGKRKCMKGLIRGFTRAALIVKDPFMSVWDEYNSLVANNTISKDQSFEDKKQMIIKIASNYSTDKLNVSHAYDRLHNIFQSENALIISYEALINPSNSLFNKSSDTQRIYSLKKLLEFAKYPDIHMEKLECAYKFIEANEKIDTIKELNSFFLQQNTNNLFSLICSMKKIFNTTFSKLKFYYISLFSDIQC